MYTRKDYLEGKVDHLTYFCQFKSTLMVSAVYNLIGVDRIVNSKDKHFNDIPLQFWDKLPNYTNTILMRKVGETVTISTKVCVAKAIAHNIKKIHFKEKVG